MVCFVLHGSYACIYYKISGLRVSMRTSVFIFQHCRESNTKVLGGPRKLTLPRHRSKFPQTALLSGSHNVCEFHLLSILARTWYYAFYFCILVNAIRIQWHLIVTLICFNV